MLLFSNTYIVYFLQPWQKKGGHVSLRQDSVFSYCFGWIGLWGVPISVVCLHWCDVFQRRLVSVVRRCLYSSIQIPITFCRLHSLHLDLNLAHFWEQRDLSKSQVELFCNQLTQKITSDTLKRPFSRFLNTTINWRMGCVRFSSILASIFDILFLISNF